MSSNGGSTKGGRGKPKSSKSVSRSQKTGLQFPVGRITRFLKAGKYAKHVGTGAPIYLSTVLEYLTAELPGLLSLSTKFLPTVMNLLKKLAEEGQRHGNTNTQQNPSLASKSFSNEASEYSEVSSSASSEVTSTKNGTEYSSPVHDKVK